MITNSIDCNIKQILIIFLIITLCNCTIKKPSVNQQEDYFSEDFQKNDNENIDEIVNKIIYENKIFSNDILSLSIGNKSIDVGEPIIDLNSNSVLKISFDQLNDQINHLQYEIIHCDLNWQESDLLEMEFLEGFKINYIDIINKSFGTLQPYVHYEFNIPNENLKILKSGNYILKIFDEYDPETLLATIKFYVSENLMDVKFKVIETSNFEQRNYQQEFESTFSYDPNIISDPYNNLYINIQQNHQEFNQYWIESPNFVRENSIVYLPNSDRVFDGGNEFRYFDISSFRKVSEKVNKINYVDSSYQIELIKDPKRSFKQYLNYRDLNGRFFLRSYDHQNSEFQSEYGWVKFHLPIEKINSDDVYIFGELSNWEINNKFKMSYDSINKEYFHKLLLKQGYYNYLFVTSNGTKTSNRTIEGAHFETENEYIIKAYYRDPIDLYDRILCYRVFNSRN